MATLTVHGTCTCTTSISGTQHQKARTPQGTAVCMGIPACPTCKNSVASASVSPGQSTASKIAWGVGKEGPLNLFTASVILVVSSAGQGRTMPGTTEVSSVLPVSPACSRRQTIPKLRCKRTQQLLIRTSESRQDWHHSDGQGFACSKAARYQPVCRRQAMSAVGWRA